MYSGAIRGQCLSVCQQSDASCLLLLLSYAILESLGLIPRFIWTQNDYVTVVEKQVKDSSSSAPVACWEIIEWRKAECA